MRLGILIAAGLCVVGAVLSYYLYGQLRTETVPIQGVPQAVAGADGASCERLTFSLEPRQMGWIWVRAQRDQETIWGRFTVQGRVDEDVGFRVFSPQNRLVLREEKQHDLDFNLPAEVWGDYRLEFDNRFSILTDKDIELTYCVR